VFVRRRNGSSRLSDLVLILVALLLNGQSHCMAVRRSRRMGKTDRTAWTPGVAYSQYVILMLDFVI
jgi:hypothetical protein